MAPDTLSLAGKVAIVTGSGRETGIGAGIARALARNGAKVTINFVSDATAPRAAGVAEQIRTAGGEAAVVQADVSSPAGAAKIVAETLAAFGTDKIDILVNNAVAGTPKRVLEATKEDLDIAFGVSVYGPLFMIQQVVPLMPRGGRIVNIGSIASKLATPSFPVYAAAKAAMDTLSFAAAADLGKHHGITINTVMPGPVNTEGPPPGPEMQEVIRLFMMLVRAEGRVGTVGDIADAVLLLVSEKSRWITGQTISLSGGITGN